MERIKFLIRKIFTCNYKDAYTKSLIIHKKRGKNTILVLFDMLWSGMKYGAGYNDYVEFEFDLLNKNQRATYLTSELNNRIVKKYNDKSYWHLFANKWELYTLFKDFLGRDFMSLDKSTFTDFKKFVKNKDKIVVKPIDGFGGKGVEIIKLNKKTNLKYLHKTLIANKQVLMEDFIKQHDDLNKLYDGSVNTLRVISFLKDNGEVVIIRTIFKVGVTGEVDNNSSGGMYTFLDNTGKVIVPAFDVNDTRYTVHPKTGIPIVGFQIPLYDKIFPLIEQVAKIVPQMRYIGWDVAITNDGPIIVEGNEYSGLFQMKPSLSTDKTGDLALFKKYMDI